MVPSQCLMKPVKCVQVPYIVEGADDGEVVLACAHAEGGQLYPEEVSGQVLAHLLAHAQQSTGKTISKAVISVSGHCHKVLDSRRPAGHSTSSLKPSCLSATSSLQHP